MNKKSNKLELETDLIISELIKIAFASLTEVFDESGRILKPEEIPLGLWPAISSIDLENRICPNCEKITTGSLIRVKLLDKLKALELLGKYIGLVS